MLVSKIIPEQDKYMQDKTVKYIIESTCHFHLLDTVYDKRKDYHTFFIRGQFSPLPFFGRKMLVHIELLQHYKRNIKEKSSKKVCFSKFKISFFKSFVETVQCMLRKNH